MSAVWFVFLECLYMARQSGPCLQSQYLGGGSRGDIYEFRVRLVSRVSFMSAVVTQLVLVLEKVSLHMSF